MNSRIIIDNLKITKEYLDNLLSKKSLDDLKNIFFEMNGKKYSLNNISILNKFKKKYLNLKPYPYLVISNCLEKEVYNHLDNFYPSDDFIYNNEAAK